MTAKQIGLQNANVHKNSVQPHGFACRRYTVNQMTAKQVCVQNLVNTSAFCLHEARESTNIMIVRLLLQVSGPFRMQAS